MKTKLSVILFFLLVSSLIGQEVNGLLILKIKESSANNSAVEYTSIDYLGEFFKARLPGGKIISGYASKHIAKHLIYNYSNLGQLQAQLQQLALQYPGASQVIQARVSFLKQMEEAKLNSNNSLSSSPKPGFIPKAELGGKTYVNLTPRTIKNGILSFIHDSGIISVPVDSLNYRGLVNCRNLAPALASNKEFSQVISTYISVLNVGSKSLAGVRLLERSDNHFKVSTDNGNEIIHRDQLTVIDVIELEQTLVKHTAYWSAVREERDRLEAERQEQLKRLAEKEDRESRERIARMEADAKREAAAIEAFGEIIGGWLSAPTYIQIR